jgi:divalent metal cation (Fe/Co/Zn/Cd) transporter
MLSPILSPARSIFYHFGPFLRSVAKEHRRKGASLATSRRVVLAALAGNGAIALAKFAAAAISGSTAMLTEAIHSLVDTGDQILLLVGQARSEKPADATHPLGHGMEAYFWSFIVALMVFLVGGVLSAYEGVRQILSPIPIISPWISLAVLACIHEGGFDVRPSDQAHQ